MRLNPLESQKNFEGLIDRHTEFKSAKNEENISRAAEKIMSSEEEHKLVTIMWDPKWIKERIEGKGKKLEKAFSRNLKSACEILSDETGYEYDLIYKLYGLIEDKRRKLH